MKKRFCAVLTVCFTIALFFSSQAVLTVGAEDGGYVQDTDEAFDEFYKDLVEDRGEEFAKNLYRAQENDEALMALFPKNESGEPVYPDFIGGIYYNDDGNMVVQLVTDAQTSDVDLRTAVDNLIAERNIIVEYVEFSHNEISTTMDTLAAITNERPDIFDRVDSIAEDTLNNRVEIRMRVCSEEEIAWFRENVFDSPILSFVESSGPYETSISANEGALGMQSGGTTAAGQQEQHLNWYWPLVVVLCIGLLTGAWFFLFRRQARPAFAGIDAEGVSSARQGSSVSKRQIVAAIRSSDCVPREDLLKDILEKIEKQH